MKAETKKQWLLPAFVVAVILCLFFAGSRSNLPANAQIQSQTATENAVMVVPIQLERDRYGLAMVDTVGQTLWIYELSSRGPAYNRLKLLAARNWQYDRQLQQYNTARPKPEEVRLILEEIGQQEKESMTHSDLTEPNDKSDGSIEK